MAAKKAKKSAKKSTAKPKLKAAKSKRVLAAGSKSFVTDATYRKKLQKLLPYGVK